MGSGLPRRVFGIGVDDDGQYTAYTYRVKRAGLFGGGVAVVDCDRLVLEDIESPEHMLAEAIDLGFIPAGSVLGEYLADKGHGGVWPVTTPAHLARWL